MHFKIYSQEKIRLTAWLYNMCFAVTALFSNASISHLFLRWCSSKFYNWHFLCCSVPMEECVTLDKLMKNDCPVYQDLIAHILKIFSWDYMVHLYTLPEVYLIGFSWNLEFVLILDILIILHIYFHKAMFLLHVQRIVTIIHVLLSVCLP